MPQPPNRSEYEAQLTRILARLLSAYGGRLLEALGDPPSMNNLSPDFWQGESEIMMAALRPFLEQVYLDSARALMVTTPSAIDWALVNQAAVDWASTYTYNLIRGLFQTDIAALQRALAAYFQAPTTMGQLTARILQIVASPIRAEMIAVTEVTRAASEGEQAIARGLAKQGIIMTPYWNTNRDELVCPVCEPRNNLEITDGIFPPAHPRCILPGNVVYAPERIDAATKSFYVGRCVEVTTGKGRRIAVTENHPVFTLDGWIAAKDLHPGVNLMSAPNFERVAPTINPNYHNRPTAIEEIFTSFKMSVGVTVMRMPVSAEDFHGDGRGMVNNGNIEIVYSNRFLLNNRMPGNPQPICEHGFGAGNVKAFSLNGGGSQFHFGNRRDPASGGGVSSGELGDLLLRGHAAPFDSLRLGLVAGSNASNIDISAESRAIDPSLAREFVLAFPSAISLDKVVDVRYFNFSGHVYDLQVNKHELYTVNSIITHNCRCWVNYTLPKRPKKPKP